MNRSPASTCHIGRTNAFTLLELIVVIIIISVVAAVIAPRVAGLSQRAADVEAESVARLLTTLAEKDALTSGGGTAALDFDSGAEAGPTISIWTRRSVRDARTNLTSDEWAVDPLTPPLVLERLEIRQAAEDGRVLDKRRWRIMTSAGQRRPGVAMLLAPVPGSEGSAWRIVLNADATGAARTGVSSVETSVLGGAPSGRSVDLDATGKGDSAW